jgi:hypothetical protein
MTSERLVLTDDVWTGKAQLLGEITHKAGQLLEQSPRMCIEAGLYIACTGGYHGGACLLIFELLKSPLIGQVEHTGKRLSTILADGAWS